MAVIKCKMCGGDLRISENSSIAECEYCGSMQTVPSANSEKKMTLFTRANRFRAACEYDRAAGIYESIVTEFPSEAEAYWGLVLCRYGIEYVDDPLTGRKVPTCHRSGFESVLSDPDYEQAMNCAAPEARAVYAAEARAIEEIRRGIIEVSSKEKPFDVFICYKETDDETHQRTRDSIDAQEIYYRLTNDGLRVFFSRITLEDKAGTEYEPYIFAALNSAKVMVVIGSKPEYFNAVWVRNEWTRFLELKRKDPSRLLIPCYKNMDPYDLPDRLAAVQSYDMTRIGFLQDLIHGVRKVVKKSEPAPAQTPAPAPRVPVSGMPSQASLLKRAQIFLSESDWDSAGEYYNKVLDIYPESGEAYLGLLLVSARKTDRASYKSDYVLGLLNPGKEFDLAKRFASPQDAEWFKEVENERAEAAARREQINRNTSSYQTSANNPYAPAANRQTAANNPYAPAANRQAPANNPYAPAANRRTAANNPYAPAANSRAQQTAPSGTSSAPSNSAPSSGQAGLPTVPPRPLILFPMLFAGLFLYGSIELWKEGKAFMIPFAALLAIALLYLLFKGLALLTRTVSLTRSGNKVLCSWNDGGKPAKWYVAVNGKWLGVNVRSPFAIEGLLPGSFVTVCRSVEGKKIKYYKRKKFH